MYELPTHGSFINCYRAIKAQIDPFSGKTMTTKKALQIACDRAIGIWTNEGIPVVTRRVNQLAEVCHRRLMKLTKVSKGQREDEDF